MLRVYTDTSVFGGVFDPEFSGPSRVFFEQTRAGRFLLLVSNITRREISLAPGPVQDLFASLMPCMELFVQEPQAWALRDAYLAAAVLGPARSDDAGHVAAATVANADIIVSWNFKHMVNVDKIRLFCAVNSLRGYRPIDIRSPLEVIAYEEEI